MPKKSRSSSSSNPGTVMGFYHQYKHMIVPSAIGGFIAWFFSDSFKLGVMVFIAVWIGNWLGQTLLKK